MSAGRYAIELEAESKSRQLSGLQNVGSSAPIGANDDFGKSRDKAAESLARSGMRTDLTPASIDAKVEPCG